MDVLADVELTSAPALDGDPLEEAARQVLAAPTLLEAFDPEAGEAKSLLELYELLELYWDPDKHPRWPKDTPGGLGGQFMHAGQRFSLKGVEYDIDKVLPGKVYAHVATKGVSAKPQTVEFSAADLAKAERPPAETIKATKAGSWANTTATVIDPYVHPETHDPSIAIPSNSPLTPEQWARFGKEDQEWYSALQERFGNWTAGAAQKKVDDAMKAGDQASRDILNSSYASQFGSSTGFTISLFGLFKGLADKVKGTPQIETTRAKYEKARGLQADAAAALQWDLYNRARGPDIAIFHKHSAHELFQKEIIDGNKPVFAGLSQSQFWRAQFFGPYTFATPMAIRHIVMSTVSADVTHYGGFNSEQEVATADPFLADSRSLEATSFTAMQSKWLTSITSNGKSASGAVIAMLKDSMKDGGVNLPVLPSDPMVQLDGAGGHQWVSPPKEATQFAYVGGAKVSVLDLPYANVVDGKPVAKQMKDMVESGEIQAGDYIEGMQGTRYIVLPDPSDPYLHLAYYKITDTGQPIAGTGIAVAGQNSSAFSGHTLWQGSEEAYKFEGGGTKVWKKLAGHYQLITQSKEKTGFYPEAWAVGGPDDVKWMKDFKPGEKFMVGGSAYQIVEDLAGGNKRIKDLSTGKLGKVNGDCKLPPLVLKAGYSEQGQAELSPDDFMHGAPRKLGELDTGDYALVDGEVVEVAGKKGSDVTVTGASGKQKNVLGSTVVTPLVTKPSNWSKPEVGDTFALDGERATITKILKNGTVQAKKQHGGVVKLDPNDAQLAYLHRPAAYELGDKAKLKDLAVGEKFHGGTGVQQVRPYVVVAQHGKSTEVRNLDTGEVVSLSSSKSYARLTLKQTAAVAPVIDHASMPAPTMYDADAWQPGPEKPITEYVPGEKFLAQTPHGAIPFEYQGPSAIDPDVGVAVNLTDGKTMTLKMQYAAPLTSLVPKQATPTPKPKPPDEFVPFSGTLGELSPGDQFKVAAGGTTWEVTGPVVNGAVPTKVISSSNANVIGNAQFTHSGFTAENFQVKKATLGPEQTPPSVTSAPAAVSGPAFDPSAYNEKIDVTHSPLGELKPGTVFKGKKGGYYQIKSIKDKHVNATSLADGKHTKFASTAVPSAILVPKAASKTPYDKLMDGDPVALGDLKQGDQFVHAGTLYQIVEPSAGIDEKNATVASVFAGGNLGATTNFGSAPNVLVTFHAKKADTLQVPDHQVEAMATDPDSLEDAYVAGKLTGTAYDAEGATQVSAIAQGVWFTDANDNVFKVKQAGPQPIITDGAKLYTINGSTFVFPEPNGDAMFSDGTPEIVDTQQEVESELAHEAQKPNVGDKTFGELDLHPGDTFGVTTQGKTKTFKVTGVDEGDEPEAMIFAQSELGASHQFFKTYSPDTVAKKDDLEGLILDDEPAGVPAISAPMEGGAHGPQPAPNVLPLSQLAIGTHFTTENSPGFVYELTAKKQGGKVVQAKIVTAPGMPSAAGTGVSFQGHTVVPTQIGAAGAFDQQTAAPALPGFPSSDIADYGKGVVGSAGDFDPGTFVAGMLAAQSPYQVVSSDGLTVTLKQPGGETFDVAAATPMQQLTFGGGAGGTLKPFHLGAAVITAAGDHGYIKYIETDADGLQKYGVGSSPGSSGAANLAVAYASSLTPASVEDTTAANISSIADMPSPDADSLFLGYPPAKPSELVVGDHVIGSNGAELEVTAKGTPTTNSSGIDVYPLTLKNVETGVTGGGYYPEDTTVFDVVPPADHTVPGQSVVTGYEEAGPGFKTVGMFNDGDVIVAKGYGGAVLRLGPAKGTNYGSTAYEATVIKPGDGVYAKKVGAKTTVHGNALFRPYEGGSMWKIGEYGKVVKPGNVTGKTARVVGHEPDGKLLVRYATGKELAVEASWMHGMNYPTSSTKAKLQFEKVPAGELHPGDIISPSGSGYYEQAKLVIDSVDEGHIKTHVWGNPDAYNQHASIPSNTPVELIITARQIQGFQGSGTVAPVETPGAVMPEKPSSAMPPNPPAVGDKVSGVGTGWTAAMYVAHVDEKGLTFAKEPGGDPVTTLNWAQWKQAGGKVIPPTTPPAVTLADFEPADGVTVGELEVGDQFALMTNDGATVWEITGPPDGKYVPLKVVFSPQASVVGNITSTTTAYVPGFVKKAKQPGTVKLGTLKKGDQFEVSGYQGPEVYEVVDGGGTSGMVMAQHVSGGGSAAVSKLPFGTELDVKPVAKGTGEKTPFPEGETVAGLGLKPGDKVFTDTGSLTIQSIEGEPGTNGYVFNAVDDENGIESMYGMYGHWDAFAKAQQPEQFDPDGWVEGDEVPLETLNVGARFVSHANFDPHYYELVKDEGGVMYFKGLGPMDSDYAAGPSAAMVTLIHPKPHLADALKQNLAAVLGGESTTLLALKPGDTFHVGETHGAPEGDYKLIGSALNGVPNGEYVSSVPPKPAEAMWARNLSTGEVVWFGDQLGVTPIETLAGAAPVEGVDKTPGKPVEQMKDLEVGDHYVTPNGNVYRVDDITGGEMMSVLVKAGGKAWESQVGHGWTFKVDAQTATWKWAAQPAATAAPAAPESSAGLSDILEPYKWHKAGGGKTYPKLGTLAAGTKFADKKHATYTVKGPGAKGYVHYVDEKGQEYAAPAGSHVNVIEGA